MGTGSREEQSFPAVFAKTAGCDVTLSNVARNGFTTDDVIARELPALASFKPDFVTLGIGANDFVQRHTEGAYVANVGKILDAILAAGVRPDAVVLVPQPDWSRSPAAKGFGTPDEIHARIEKMNRVLHEEGTKRGMRWLAIEPLLAAQAARHDLATDGLHPSASAHAEWAAVLVRDVCPTD
ncbi:MAG TPA: SGNH/GDSL hydrolase family protein [Polyangiaceae bacterium]|nr:SGNH/GDSL hydrolase family protein [Polyangiaceae bacterium]